MSSVSLKFSLLFCALLVASASAFACAQLNQDDERLADQLQTVWQLRTDYRWMNYLSFQAGYIGEDSALNSHAAGINEFLVSANRLHPHAIAGFEPAMVGRYPLTERVSLLGRGGVLYWESKYYDDGNESRFSGLKERGSDFFLGTGVEVKLYKHWNLNADWTGYKVSGERSDFFGLGMSYRLNFK